MRVLLDTHTFVWWVLEPERLSGRALDVIADTENPVFVSAVTAYEVRFLASRGRLPNSELIYEDWQATLSQERFLPKALELEHANIAGGLPQLHGDPFDRMLIATALVDDLTLVTKDTVIQKYDVPTIW